MNGQIGQNVVHCRKYLVERVFRNDIVLVSIHQQLTMQLGVKDSQCKLLHASFHVRKQVNKKQIVYFIGRIGQIGPLNVQTCVKRSEKERA